MCTKRHGQSELCLFEAGCCSHVLFLWLFDVIFMTVLVAGYTGLLESSKVRKYNSVFTSKKVIYCLKLCICYCLQTFIVTATMVYIFVLSFMFLHITILSSYKVKQQK